MKQDNLNEWLELVNAEAAFSGLANAVPEAAVFAVDERRRIIFWSDAAERILGYPASEILGEHCLKANRCEACIRGCGIAQHGLVEGQPLTLFRPDGSEAPVRKSGRAFFDQTGRFLGGVEVLVPERTTFSAAASDDKGSYHGLVGRDPAMLQVFQTVKNVSETEATVLVRGESGSGKELVARALHQESHRRDRPFVAVNCAALTTSLLQSELFGHLKGAFTGAVRDRVGLFQQAHAGTLFLDEVAELPSDVQAKLLRVLEDKVVVPVGASEPVQVDIRLVAATHRSLRDEVAAGRFRADLLYRLRVVPIYLPPLRERKQDIEPLLWHLVSERQGFCRRSIRAVEPAAMQALWEYDWPGNVRELRNVLEYVCAVGRSPEIRLAELPRELQQQTQSPSRPPLRDQLEKHEIDSIKQALDRAGGHVGEAAKLLGMSRPTFWRKRKRYGVRP